MEVAIKSYDKSLRVPNNNPQTTLPAVLKNNARKGRTGETTVAKKILRTDSYSNIKYKILDGRKEAEEENREQALNILNDDDAPHSTTIYTDGSAKDGTHHGGTGVVVTHSPVQHQLTSRFLVLILLSLMNRL